MPSGKGYRVSRRQVLKVGAGTVVIGALGIEAGQRGAAVSVCVLDTSLASGQVLAVRA